MPTYIKENLTGNIMLAQDNMTSAYAQSWLTDKGYTLTDFTIGEDTWDSVDTIIQAQTEQAKSYSDHRASSYPSIPDQLDYIYHNGIEKWKADMILPVKEKYPKGAE